MTYVAIGAIGILVWAGVFFYRLGEALKEADEKAKRTPPGRGAFHPDWYKRMGE